MTAGRMISIVLSTAMIGWLPPSRAQDVFPETPPGKFGLTGSYGTVTMNGRQWQRFSFRPDIPIGDLGIGFDLELFIDPEGRISDKGWDLSTSGRAWDSIIRKIYYVRYGDPLDRVYVRAGALDDVTLGYGLIMGGYRNTLDYPAEKKLGGVLSLQNVGTFGIGVQAMVNSIADLRNDGMVAGTRVSFRPLKPFDLALADRLTVGLTLVRDINQFAGLSDDDGDGYPDFQDGFPADPDRWADSDGDGFADDIDIDADGDNVLDYLPDGRRNDQDIELVQYLNIRERKNGVTVSGIDVGLPLVEREDIHVDVYGQYAALRTGDAGLDGGWGVGMPGVRMAVGPVTAQLEYRHTEGRFEPDYFDNLYEHARVELVGGTVIRKEETLADDVLNGVYGQAGWRILNFAEARAGFQYMRGDRTYYDVSGVATVLPDLLDMIPKISILDAYFYNRRVDTKQYGLFEFTPSTLYGTRIGIALSPVVSVVWSTRYTFSPTPSGGLEKHRFLSIETVFMVQ